MYRITFVEFTNDPTGGTPNRIKFIALTFAGALRKARSREQRPAHHIDIERLGFSRWDRFGVGWNMVAQFIGTTTAMMTYDGHIVPSVLATLK